MRALTVRLLGTRGTPVAPTAPASLVNNKSSTRSSRRRRSSPLFYSTPSAGRRRPQPDTTAALMGGSRAARPLQDLSSFHQDPPEPFQDVHPLAECPSALLLIKGCPLSDQVAADGPAIRLDSAKEKGSGLACPRRPRPRRPWPGRPVFPFPDEHRTEDKAMCVVSSPIPHIAFPDLFLKVQEKGPGRAGRDPSMTWALGT